MYKVDLNSDLGESFGAYTIGMDEAVIAHVSSANVACGYHAGDPLVMDKTVAACKAAGAAAPQACAFVRGQLIPFEEMEAYQIYEDAQYICYDMTDLFYTDLRQYTESMIAQLGGIFFDEQIWDRVQNINAYYREHLPSLLRRTES